MLWLNPPEFSEYSMLSAKFSISPLHIIEDSLKLVTFVMVRTEEINVEFIKISCTEIEVDPITLV